MFNSKMILTFTIITASLFANTSARACGCTKHVMDAGPVINQVLHDAVDLPADYEFKYEDMSEIKAYPSLSERLNLGGFKGTSCEGHHKDGVSTYVCAPSYKSDYVIKIPAKNCEVTVQVKGSYTQVTAKTLDSTCE